MKPERKIWRTVAYYLSYITIGFATGIIGPTLPGLSRHTGTDLGGISYLFPILSVGYLIGSFVGGRMYDKVKGHPVTAAGLVLLLVSMFFIPITPLIWVLLVLFFISGIASGSTDVGGNTLLIWTHGKGVGPYMVGLHFFYGLGAFIAPMIVGQTIRLTSDITWAYRILAIICVPVIIYLLAVKSPKHTVKEDADRSAGANRLLILLISLFMFLHVGAELSFGGWIYSFALKMNIAGETGAAYLTSAYWGTLTIGRLIAVAVALKLKPKTMLIIDLVGCIAAVTLLLILPANVAAVWTGTILLGFFIAALVPTTFTFAGEHMDISGRIAGWFVIGLGTGNLFFPWLVGQLFEPRGAVVLPFINLLTFAAALALVFVMLGIIRKKKTAPGTLA